MYGRRAIIPPQQEKKGYSLLTEVGIPLAQFTVATWAITFALGLATYLVVRAGPEPVGVVVSAAVFLGTVYLCFFRDVSRDAQAVGTLMGTVLLVASQWGFVELARRWPRAWAFEEVWRNWFHTWYVGPMIGCTVLAIRMLREVWNPMRTGAPIYVGPETEGKDKRSKRRPYERKVWVHSVKNDDGDTVREQPVEVEDVWEEEVPEPTLKEHLLAFIVAASRVGLSKNAWLKPHTERRVLRTGLKVSKGEYDRLIGTLRGMGILNKPGSGEATEWLIEPRHAFALVGSSVAMDVNFEASRAYERKDEDGS